jgi:hypothetical protein
MVLAAPPTRKEKKSGTLPDGMEQSGLEGFLPSPASTPEPQTSLSLPLKLMPKTPPQNRSRGWALRHFRNEEAGIKKI